MGKDYRHKAKNRFRRYDDDGFAGMRKLEYYDPSKARKQNKINISQLSPLDEEDSGLSFTGDNTTDDSDQLTID